MGELSVGRSDSREWSLTQHRKSHKAHRLSVTSNGSDHLCLWDRSVNFLRSHGLMEQWWIVHRMQRCWTLSLIPGSERVSESMVESI